MLILSVLFVTQVATGFAAHMYYIGVVTSFSDNQLVLDGKEYLLATKVKVVLKEVGGNGAIHEKTGRLSHVNVGNKITIKVARGEVIEIEKVVPR